jgi:hypothetical protein
LRRILSFRFPHKYDEFVDLCAFTNISLFIFDESLHGYYIHGQSPSGQADGPIEKLRTALDFEKGGGGLPRGLIRSEPNLQTYEVWIPYDMRKRYEMIFKAHLNSEVDLKRKEVGIESQLKLPSIPKAFPRTVDIRSMEERKKLITALFINYINEAKSNESRYVINKTCSQTFLKLPPQDLKGLKGTPIFIKGNI